MALSLTLAVTMLLKSKTTSWVNITFVTDKTLLVEEDKLQINIVKTK